MQQTTVTTEKTTNEEVKHSPATSVLAVVGFVALILIGIVLAIYAARYVPIAIKNMTGSGNSTATTTLTAVPSTALSFDDSAVMSTTTDATTTDATATTTTQTSTAQTGWTTTPFNDGSSQMAGAGATQYQTYASQYYFPGSTQVQVPVENYGLSNLTVQITDVGYYDRNGNFVSDDSLNQDDELVVKMLVTNNGTNSTGEWNIRTTIPTQSDKNFEFDQDEPSLNAGATLPLTLDLTRGKLDVGNNQQIKVTVDANHDVTESNENDNTDTEDIDVRK